MSASRASPSIARAAIVCAALLCCAAGAPKPRSPSALAQSSSPEGVDEATLALAASARLSLPLHGNWCGPGHGGQPDTACIDRLDCACKAHDLCYARYFYLNCRCDNDLVSALRGARGAKAAAVRAFFKVSLCVGPRTLPIKLCKRCRTVFGKRVCVSVPCGLTPTCTPRAPAALLKRTVKRYTC